MNATKNTSFILSIDIRHSLLQLQKFNVNNSRELFLTDNYLKKSSFLCLQLEEIIPQTPCCSELMCNWERSTEFERSHMAKVKYFGVKIPITAEFKLITFFTLLRHKIQRLVTSVQFFHQILWTRVNELFFLDRSVTF